MNESAFPFRSFRSFASPSRWAAPQRRALHRCGRALAAALLLPLLHCAVLASESTLPEGASAPPCSHLAPESTARPLLRTAGDPHPSRPWRSLLRSVDAAPEIARARTELQRIRARLDGQSELAALGDPLSVPRDLDDLCLEAARAEAAWTDLRLAALGAALERSAALRSARLERRSADLALRVASIEQRAADLRFRSGSVSELELQRRARALDAARVARRAADTALGVATGALAATGTAGATPNDVVGALLELPLPSGEERSDRLARHPDLVEQRDVLRRAEVSARLTVPPYASAAAAAAARRTLREATSALRGTETRLAEEVARSLSEIATTAVRLDLRAADLELALRVAQAQAQRLDLGVGSQLDLLNARRAALDVESALTDAEHDLARARLALFRTLYAVPGDPAPAATP